MFKDSTLKERTAVKKFLREYHRLRRTIEHHRHRYYVLADPEIDDFEFDMMFKELQDIEREFIGIECACSPTQLTENHDIVMKWRAEKGIVDAPSTEGMG